MAHQVYVNTSNITQLVGNLGWESNVDTLGVKLDFNLAYSDVKGFPRNVVSIGDIVTLRNGNKEIFRGIVVSESASGRSPRSYTCFDFAFYLNKSKTIIQFNGHTADDAIRKVLIEFNVPHNVTDISTQINTIYKDKVVSDIIKDILEQATNELGVKYRMEMRGWALFIEKQTDLVVSAMVDLISNPSRKRSIEEMKNSIIIISDKDQETSIVATAKDSNSIRKYGLLQEIRNVNEEEMAQAQNIAHNVLNDLNRIKEDNSIELLGNDDVRAGRILKVNEPITGMSGKYLITSCKHTVNNGIHKMSLSLGVT
ncbi:hypothetical protein CON65_15935 [Bacillus pseudomycoides]|uniref:YqbQ/XkdQ domain-containing protein n=1 Tax=Bacillus pseudomycoides TaxID=64104 RepID=A0AA91VAK4_9BACI|nr:MULTISPECIES: hypothetical protein [Bacillus]PEB56246.1 hypothetical protein COO03_01370 [Bacillus sp. AFS098217]PED81676.1 hypothetical protein CON65_15935 [Bacillus pseudomycoides]